MKFHYKRITLLGRTDYRNLRKETENVIKVESIITDTDSFRTLLLDKRSSSLQPTLICTGQG